MFLLIEELYFQNFRTYPFKEYDIASFTTCIDPKLVTQGQYSQYKR